jgi:hypothetical protein
MAGTRDDDAERLARTEELLRRLREQSDLSREERRVITEAIVEGATKRKASGVRAEARATKRSVTTAKRTGRKRR